LAGVSIDIIFLIALAKNPEGYFGQN
jgi:hypothetical protein